GPEPALREPRRLPRAQAARAMRHAVIALVAVAAVAAMLRLAHQLEITKDILTRMPAGDERTFATLAHEVAEGRDAEVPYQAPLYPLLLGALERAVSAPRPPLAEARLLQALLGLVAAGIAARIA